MKATLTLSAVCLLALAAYPASSQSITPLLTATAGTGSDESFLVLDFENGTINDSYAFGYFYNQSVSNPVTGLDMIEGLANVGLSVTTTTYNFTTGPSVFVDSLSYSGQSEGITPSNGFWYYTTSNDGVNWTDSGTGADSRILTNGSYDGWSWSASGAYPGPAPVTPLAISVPEVGSGWLCLIGLPLVLAVIRRRTARS